MVLTLTYLHHDKRRVAITGYMQLHEMLMLYTVCLLLHLDPLLSTDSLNNARC
jgi:hypothetical protein